MLTWMCIMQSPFQSLLRPAMWIPGIKLLHSHKERWILQDPHLRPEQFVDAIEEAVKKLQRGNPRGETFVIDKTIPSKDLGDQVPLVKNSSDKENGFVRIHAYTRAEWLDVMEIYLQDDSIKVRSFSSGFLPLIIPFSCIFNLAFFWVPFCDRRANKIRTEFLKSKLKITVDPEFST